MKKNKMLRLRIVYVRVLLIIYMKARNIPPKFSSKLKVYIEKISLKNGKKIYDILVKNNLRVKQ